MSSVAVKVRLLVLEIVCSIIRFNYQLSLDRLFTKVSICPRTSYK